MHILKISICAKKWNGRLVGMKQRGNEIDTREVQII
jgi:hypothetical protein